MLLSLSISFSLFRRWLCLSLPIWKYGFIEWVIMCFFNSLLCQMRWKTKLLFCSMYVCVCAANVVKENALPKRSSQRPMNVELFEWCHSKTKNHQRFYVLEMIFPTDEKLWKNSSRFGSFARMRSQKRAYNRSHYFQMTSEWIESVCVCVCFATWCHRHFHCIIMVNNKLTYLLHSISVWFVAWLVCTWYRFNYIGQSKCFRS